MTEMKERVIAALKDMLVTTRYPKVTVNELCLRARISRNTFYANFEDKDDVIRLVFESSVLQPIRDLNRLLDLSDLEPLMERMNEQMYERLAAEGEFFKNLIGPIFGKDDTFLRIATRQSTSSTWSSFPRPRGSRTIGIRTISRIFSPRRRPCSCRSGLPTVCAFRPRSSPISMVA